ncbi:GIY-YIG nuclease family protein [Vibrio splendidus]
MDSILNQLKKSVVQTVALSKEWFELNSKLIDRVNYFKRGALNDNGTGSVYAYFSSDGECLYVGQTSRTIKARQHDQTSAHKNKDWWSDWDHVRFVQEKNNDSRLLLEILLIQAYEPNNNVKPKAVGLNDWLQS